MKIVQLLKRKFLLFRITQYRRACSCLSLRLEIRTRHTGTQFFKIVGFQRYTILERSSAREEKSFAPARGREKAELKPKLTRSVSVSSMQVGRAKWNSNSLEEFSNRFITWWLRANSIGWNNWKLSSWTNNFMFLWRPEFVCMCMPISSADVSN